MCGNKTILPTSCTLPLDGLKVDDHPFARGGFGDIYDGTLNGSAICVKRLQVPTKDELETTTKVCFLMPSCLSCLSSPRVPVDVPPRGHYLEAPETPKHITPVGRHHLSTSTYFGTDSWWEFVTLHPRKPCRRLAGTCACLSRSYYPTLTPFTSYPASRGASTTFTRVM